MPTFIPRLKSWASCLLDRDFVVKEKTAITKAIQVCYEVTSRNKEREVNGLLEAMDHFGLEGGYILTADQEEEIRIAGRVISLIPARKFQY